MQDLAKWGAGPKTNEICQFRPVLFGSRVRYRVWGAPFGRDRAGPVSISGPQFKTKGSLDGCRWLAVPTSRSAHDTDALEVRARSAGVIEPLGPSDDEARQWLDCELASLVEGHFHLMLNAATLGLVERLDWE